MTSLSPEQHGVEDGRRGIGRNVPTLAAALHADGFRTAAIVANAYAGLTANLHSGFEEFWQPNRFVAGTLRRLALEWIAKHADEPFFLYLHLIDPHADYMPPDGFRASFTDPAYEGDLTGRFEQVKPFMRRDRPLPYSELAHLVGLYDGEIAYTDRQLGLFFDELREAGLWEESLVVIVADHGEEFKDHRSLGHCRTLYDELVRIPMIIKLPGGRPDGLRSRVPEIARIVDVAPTILQLTASPMPTEFRGESLIEMMRAPTSERDAYMRTRSCDGRLPLKEGIVHHRFKLVVNGNGSEELYDLLSDPTEVHNVAGQEPEVLAALRARLEAARSANGADESVVKEISDKDRAQLRALGYISP